MLNALSVYNMLGLLVLMVAVFAGTMLGSARRPRTQLTALALMAFASMAVWTAEGYLYEGKELLRMFLLHSLVYASCFSVSWVVVTVLRQIPRSIRTR